MLFARCQAYGHDLDGLLQKHALEGVNPQHAWQWAHSFSKVCVMVLCKRVFADAAVVATKSS